MRGKIATRKRKLMDAHDGVDLRNATFNLLEQVSEYLLQIHC